MRHLGLWFFILALPLIAVFGQDVYMAYTNPHGFDFTKPFPFSDAGWIWQRRAYDSWRWTHDEVDPNLWRKFIKPVLDQKAVVVASAPLVLFMAVLLLFKLIGAGPFAGRGMLIRRAPGLGRRYTADETGGAKPKVRYKRR